MKKINFALLFLSLSFLTSSVIAESLLKSTEDVIGSWKLDHTKKSTTSTEIIKREDTWTFKNGSVTITHIPRDGTYYDQPPVNYEIEDGKLKVALLGRSDKFDTFTLIEKDDKSMTLKGKYGDIYFFTKK
ncbi:hypothetical protein [Methylomonas sp. MgM2]